MLFRSHGHSGSKVYLKEIDGVYCVEKIGNTSRNVERMSALYKMGYHVPKIYLTMNDNLLMEYIHGLDMRNFLVYNKPLKLMDFIYSILDEFSRTVTGYKDYTETYHKKLEWLPSDFLFTKEQLIDRLPKLLPQSMYHGDLTLENILYTNPDFHLIDPVTIEYDS